MGSRTEKPREEGKAFLVRATVGPKRRSREDVTWLPPKGLLEWPPDPGEMQDTGGVDKVTMSSLQGQGQSLITDKTAKDLADGE